MPKVSIVCRSCRTPVDANHVVCPWCGGDVRRLLTPSTRSLIAELSGPDRRQLKREAQDTAAALCLWFLGGALVVIGTVLVFSLFGGDVGFSLLAGGLLVHLLGYPTYHGWRPAPWIGWSFVLALAHVEQGSPPEVPVFLVGLFALTRLARWPRAVRDWVREGRPAEPALPSW